MIYVILIIGLALICFSINSMKIGNITSGDTFDSLVDNNSSNFYEKEILKAYIEIEDKVIKLEQRIESLEEEIHIKDKEYEIIYENFKKGTKLYNLNELKFVEELGVVESQKDINMTINSEEYSVLGSDDEVSVHKNESQVDAQNTIKNKEILLLYNEGRSIEEIASTLRIGKGEVLLRIGLQKREK
ncbi:DUF6115 domain-containing protein [Clostridium cylindrosporum]|uniref:Uncharacterized protein n=1 Tax=Clostridium cylindrosporum DSM 605 TaxID=1121307 RepID=A0A0J8DBN0_CLOCY|nr:hypothetical protein [Clostridium cylindrosporum]KMT21719.1 hypothetical protein CLCY_2c04810 [Clostridium cylindrosporum DSM 605]